MLLFCPNCGNILHVEEVAVPMTFSCNTCPYNLKVNRRISSKTYPKRKEVDDILGGSAALENAETTDEACPKCRHPKAYFTQMQTRSADEPMTTFYKCCDSQCGHNWRD